MGGKYELKYLADALADCLEARLQGEDELRRCLEKYPKCRDELAALLELAARLPPPPMDAPPAEWRKQTLSILLAKIQTETA